MDLCSARKKWSYCNKGVVILTGWSYGLVPLYPIIVELVSCFISHSLQVSPCGHPDNTEGSYIPDKNELQLFD